MEFRVLGPFEVLDDNPRVVLPRAAKERALLAILLLRRNKVVAKDGLIELLWGGGPPDSADNTLQTYVSRLRKLLQPDQRPGEDGLIVTRPPGYLLRVARNQLDLECFETLISEAHASADPTLALDKLRGALALWRGPPLSEFASEEFAQGEIRRIDELRLSALEARIELELQLGRAGVLVGELESLIAANPLRESLRAQLMLALYRCRRQAEALQVYQDTWRFLDELGVEPSQPLRDLHGRILRQDPTLEVATAPMPKPAGVPPTPAPVEPPPPTPARHREARKTVTVLFCDLVNFTSLGQDRDPEALRRLMWDHYFVEMRRVIERHGGTVEKHIGDAIMAVFGIPVVHEDDALRAVRAADDMRNALSAINLELERTWGIRLVSRIGVDTGEVIAADPSSGDLFATGESLVIAKRLEEFGEAGDVMISESTHRLVRDAVRAESAGPLVSKSTGISTTAFRVLEVAEGASGRARRFDAPLIGREQQLERLRGSFEQAVSDRVCHLFTVLGPAGIGKSRLVEEFVRGLGGGVTVLRGRCLPYGDGITYWPIAELVREAAGVGAGSEEDAVASIAAQLAGEDNAAMIAARVAEVAGLGRPSGGASEETFWAVRKLFEALAGSQPLVVILDDLQWAESTFLELVEHIATFSRNAPMLILGMARPELLEKYPDWWEWMLKTSWLRLEPLDEHESRQQISNYLGGPLAADVAKRIVETSEGNPLFTEELLAMLEDDEVLTEVNGRWIASAEFTERRVPPSIIGLLTERLEQLGDDERTVVERASVEGALFHRGSLYELCPESVRPTIERSVAALVRKDMIRPDRPDFADEHAFRFRHLLIRDAAYLSIPKTTRADLHERFAGWLERMARARPQEFEEVVGYHLEQAYRYCVDIGPPDRSDLATRAADRLDAAGRRAVSRSDLPAGANLLKRAASLLPDDDPRGVELRADHGAVLIQAGRLAEADAVLAAARESASAARDERAGAHVDVQHALLELQRAARQSVEEAAAVVAGVIPAFERCDDNRGLCRARWLEAWVYWHGGRGDAAAAAWHKAAEHARRSGDDHARAEALTWVASAMVRGPTPAQEAIMHCEAIAAEVKGDLPSEAATLRHLAVLHAMEGRFGRARELLTTVKAIFDELGVTLHSAVEYAEADVEMLAADPRAAEGALRPGYEALEGMGDRALRCAVAAVLARAIFAQGRDDEAEEFTEVTEETAAAGDLQPQIVWRAVRARILAKRGRLEAAEALAREAVALAEQTDFLNDRASTLTDLAEVLRVAGHIDAADAAASEALGLYEEKGNLVAAREARTRGFQNRLRV